MRPGLSLVSWARRLTNGHDWGKPDWRSRCLSRSNKEVGECAKARRCRARDCPEAVTSESEASGPADVVNPVRPSLVSRPLPTVPPRMAWRCSGLTNVELIENMSRNGLINSARVRNVCRVHRPVDRLISISKPGLPLQAMKQVERANYVLDKRDAYVDAPQ